MSVNKLYGIIEGGELSPEDCAEINSSLAKIRLEEIPDLQHQNLRDYLVQALNMNSVEFELIEPLENLLGELEACL